MNDMNRKGMCAMICVRLGCHAERYRVFVCFQNNVYNMEHKLFTSVGFFTPVYGMCGIRG